MSELAEILEHEFFASAFSTIRDEKTKRHYRRAVRWLGESHGEPASVKHLTDEGVRRVMRYLAESRGQEPATVNTSRKFLIALARWLRDEGKIERVPRVPKLIEPYNPPESLTDDQLAELWRAATTATGTIGGAPANVWWPTLLWCEADAAVRAGELRALRWDWIDMRTGIVRVPWQFRKGRRRGEVYRFGAESLAWLAKIRPFTFRRLDSLVLGNVTTDRYYAEWSKMQTRAGLPRGRRWKTHCLRRTVATLGVVAGVDPSRILRHSSPNVAWESYVDPTPTATATTAAIGRLLAFAPPCHDAASGGVNGFPGIDAAGLDMNSANAG